MTYPLSLSFCHTHTHKINNEMIISSFLWIKLFAYDLVSLKIKVNFDKSLNVFLLREAISNTFSLPPLNS